MSFITATTQLETTECCDCGMLFALSKTWMDHARNIGKFKQKFWCPYCGAQQGWGESRDEKKLQALREERDRAIAQRNYQKERKEYAEKEAEHFRRSRDGMKGQLVRVKNRVGKGVCPCCNRTFANLARHMASKHPDFAPKPESSES